MTGTRFATVGDNCIDRFLPPVNHCLVGGNAVNVAVKLAGLGRSAAYFGAVGDDAAGAAVRLALAGNGVDVASLRYVAGVATARTDIETLPGGDRRFVFEDFGACLDYRPDAADLARLSRMSHVHVGWLRGSLALRGALRQAGVVVSQDLSVNIDPAETDPAGLDIAFASASPEAGEAESYRLLAAGAKCAVVTLGAAGCLANEHGKVLRLEATPIAAEDTTGAGDAFIAGFLDASAKGLKLIDCLAAGQVAGGLACCHRGGFPQAPFQPFVHDIGSLGERPLEPD